MASGSKYTAAQRAAGRATQQKKRRNKQKGRSLFDPSIAPF